MNLKNPIGKLIVLLVLSACDSPPPLAVELSVETKPSIGDMNKGQNLAKQCSRCHGTTGISIKAGIPFLAGQHNDYLISSLTDIKEGNRTHPELANPLRKYDKITLQTLAGFFSQQSGAWKGANGLIKKTSQRASLSRGTVAKTPCVGCHGIDGNSDNPDIPSLAGLQSEYFIKAFENYFAERRKGTIMKHFKRSVDWQTLQDLALYYSTQKRRVRKMRLPGNPTKGKMIAAECDGCHGVRGSTVLPGMPNLAHQNPKYMVNAILAYNNGKRQNALMKQATAHLSEKQIRDVASYYARIDNTEYIIEDSKGFDPIKVGARLAQNCQGCHGVLGNSTLPGIPSISGFGLAYFLKAFDAYRNGDRQHRMMPLFANNMNASQSEKLALYYQQADVSKRRLYADKTEVSIELLTTCNACHGYRGQSDDASIPSLAGQDRDYLRIAILAYQRQLRPQTAMQDVTQDLTEADIVNLANHYAAQQALSPTPKSLSSPQVLSQKCDRCHGPLGQSTIPSNPRLAGQSESYLIKALLDYKNSARSNSIMYAMAEVLSLSEIEAIAAFYAKQ